MLESLEFEAQRLTLQAQLDLAKTQAERNRLGQFATPSSLAVEILEHAESLVSASELVRFLDQLVPLTFFFTHAEESNPWLRNLEDFGHVIAAELPKLQQERGAAIGICANVEEQGDIALCGRVQRGDCRAFVALGGAQL